MEVDYRLNIRRVNFKWQRGIKIGKVDINVMCMSFLNLACVDNCNSK